MMVSERVATSHIHNDDNGDTDQDQKVTEPIQDVEPGVCELTTLNTSSLNHTHDMIPLPRLSLEALFNSESDDHPHLPSDQCEHTHDDTSLIDSQSPLVSLRLPNNNESENESITAPPSPIPDTERRVADSSRTSFPHSPILPPKLRRLKNPYTQHPLYEEAPFQSHSRPPKQRLRSDEDTLFNTHTDVLGLRRSHRLQSGTSQPQGVYYDDSNEDESSEVSSREQDTDYYSNPHRKRITRQRSNESLHHPAPKGMRKIQRSSGPSEPRIRFSLRSKPVFSYKDSEDSEDSEDPESHEESDEEKENSEEEEESHSKNKATTRLANEVRVNVMELPSFSEIKERVIEQVLDHCMEEPLKDGSSSIVTLEKLQSESVTYCIKWRGCSHIHNTWETFTHLIHLVGATSVYRRKLDNYIAIVLEEMHSSSNDLRDDNTDIIVVNTMDEREERLVERELQRQLFKEYTQGERVLCSRHGHLRRLEYYVKWRNLPYAECSWEDVNDVPPALIVAFERRERNTRVPDLSAPLPIIWEPRKRPSFITLDTQPSWLALSTTSSSSPPLLLRDYQLAGLNWLAYSWHRNVNTILADEMGLGKTIQTSAFLAYLYHQMELDGPFLIIVPLSTIHAWAIELARWAPDLNVIVYIGDSRSRQVILDYEFYKPNPNPRTSSTTTRIASKNKLLWNVLLTTYELVLKDKSILGQIPWTFLAVDEAHRLKNENSLLHTTLKSSFSFANRLLITGTPLQNSLRELYALLSFLEPSAFPDEWAIFEQSVLQNTGQQNMLSRLHDILKPRLLRRLKKDVEKSLPQKTERILRVDLSPLQRLLYRWIITRNYTELNRNFRNLMEGDPSQQKPSKPTSLLNIVGELRKAASHPYLFSNPQTLLARRVDPEGIVYHSGKMVLLDALLRRLLADGHRVLLFSQSVAMLDLLSEFFSLRSYPHLRLDGGVAAEARRRAIERFNAPGSIYSLFLLSTRAGGLGINLETADTVILFDSDWNPQNDLQAMARAHRIGQQRAVNVYRLVSSHTIEEEMVERGKRKMVLDHLVIQRMDTSGRTILNLRKSEGEEDNDIHTMNNSMIPSTRDLHHILLFGAKALFSQTPNPSPNPEDTLPDDESHQVLLHQLLLPSALSVRALVTSSNTDKDAPILDLIGLDADHLPPSLSAILSRPASLSFINLDAVLERAEKDASEPNPNPNPDPDPNPTDTSFLDSFQVADLSGALSWDSIIPESERNSLSLAERELNERTNALQQLVAFEKRQAMKKGALQKMSSYLEKPSKQHEESEEDLPRKKAVTTIKHQEGSSLQEEVKKLVQADSYFSNPAKVSLPSLFILILRGLQSFGEIKLGTRLLYLRHLLKSSSDSLLVQEESLDTMSSCVIDRLATHILSALHSFNSEPLKPANETNTSLGASKRYYFYGVAVYPQRTLERISQLNKLTHLITCNSLSNEDDSSWIEGLYSAAQTNRLRLSWRKTLKPPSFSKVIPWTTRDDTRLLLAVARYGYASSTSFFTPLELVLADSTLELSKKIELLLALKETIPLSKKSKKGISGNKEQSIGSSLDQLKRRIDYLLDHLSDETDDNSVAHPSSNKESPASTKKIKSVDSSITTSSSSSNHQTTLDHSFTSKPVTSKPSTTGKKSSSLQKGKSEPALPTSKPSFICTADMILSQPILSKLFRKLFKPIKKFLLALDDLDEKDTCFSPVVTHDNKRLDSLHHRNQEESSLVSQIVALLRVIGAYIEGLVMYQQNRLSHLSESQSLMVPSHSFFQLPFPLPPPSPSPAIASTDPLSLFYWAHNVIYSVPIQDFASLPFSSSDFFNSCWEFIQLCWPSEISSLELMDMYKKLSSSSSSSTVETERVSGSAS